MGGPIDGGRYGRWMHKTDENLIDRVDHLVYAVPDLPAGVAAIETMLRTTAEPGGRHRDLGTANALVGLGGSRYLEIVGPDPERTDRAVPSIFLIDRLTAPRLVTWAAKATDLIGQATDGLVPGLLGEVSAGQRTRVDGTTIRWRLTDPYTDRLGGVVPFLIDWGAVTHPTDHLEPDCELVRLEIGHPDPTGVDQVLSALDIRTHINRLPTARLTATISTPAGSVRLA